MRVIEKMDTLGWGWRDEEEAEPPIHCVPRQEPGDEVP